MPRGQPDFGAQTQGDIVSLLDDVAELAARLNSIVIFDRRGKVGYLDDFEAPVWKWIHSITPGSTVTWSHIYPKSGAQCVCLTPDAVALEHAGIVKEFGVVTSQKLGIEFAFANPSPELSYEIEVAYWDGTNFHRAKIKVDFSTSRMSVWTGAGAWTDYRAIPAFFAAGYSYYPIKLVADFSTNTYLRGMFNGTWYDLSAYNLSLQGGAGAPRLQIACTATNETGVAGSIYVDDCIFTQEET